LKNVGVKCGTKSVGNNLAWGKAVKKGEMLQIFTRAPYYTLKAGPL